METDNETESSQATEAQRVLIAKILRSSKLSDKEYRTLRSFADSKVVTKYDASILIDYVLVTLKFRRHFLSSNHKAYKKCAFCGSRDNISRYDDVSQKNQKIWCCETCALNLPDKVVPIRTAENA